MKHVVVSALIFAGTLVHARADETEALRSIIRAEQERLAIPGLTVAITRAGETLLNEGFGVTDAEAKAPATTETVYQIGSISKQFTAAGIMRLVEAGKLKLDSRVREFFPEAHESWDDVRVSHLLHQTSGIREFFTIPKVGKALTDHSRGSAELIAFVVREPLAFKPGDRWSYSNSNYALLGAIIEKLSGMPYEQYLAREFFEPLGLKSLHHCESKPARPKLATGYHMRDGKAAPAEIENMNWARGDGGLCGTAGDLAKWARELAKGRAVTAESYRQMVSSKETKDGVRPSYGFGVSLVELDDRTPRISHGGAVSGFSNTLAYYPEKDLAIAVLTNRNGIWAQAIEQRVARALLQLPVPEYKPQPLTPAERQRYTGTYESGVVDFPLRIVEHSDRLRLEAKPPAPSADLRYIGGGRFVAENEPDAIQLDFGLIGNAAAEHVKFTMAGMHWYGRRVMKQE